MARHRDTQPPESRMAPAPEGPEEVYRRFERPNRRGPLGGLRRLAGVSGKKALYSALVAAEVAAIVLGFFFDVPFMDTLAIALPPLFVTLLGDSKSDEPASDAPDGDSLFERLLKRLGGPPDGSGEDLRR